MSLTCDDTKNARGQFEVPPVRPHAEIDDRFKDELNGNARRSELPSGIAYDARFRIDPLGTSWCEAAVVVSVANPLHGCVFDPRNRRVGCLGSSSLAADLAS